MPEARRQAESSRISFTGGPCRCGEGGKCPGNPLCFYILYFFQLFIVFLIFFECLFMSLFYSTHLFSQLRRPTRERSPSSVPIRKHSSRSQSYAAMTPEFVNSQHSRNKIVRILCLKDARCMWIWKTLDKGPVSFSPLGQLLNSARQVYIH